MKRNRLIPFRITPASWGLEGDAYKRAEINYYYEGEERECLLVELDARDEKDRELRLLDIKKKHGRISDFDYDLSKAEIESATEAEYKRRSLDIALQYGTQDRYTYEVNVARLENEEGGELDLALLEIDHRHEVIDGYEYERKSTEIRMADSRDADREVRLLDIDLAYGKITEQEHGRKRADLLGEPYVYVKSFEYDNANKRGNFELDWNDKFIEDLAAAGYTGMSNDAMVDRWLTDLCRAIAEDSPQTVLEPEEVQPPHMTRPRIRTQTTDDGITEHS